MFDKMKNSNTIHNLYIKTKEVVVSKLGTIIGTFIAGLLTTFLYMTYDYVTGLLSKQDALVEGYEYIDYDNKCNKPVIYVDKNGNVKIK